MYFFYPEMQNKWKTMYAEIMILNNHTVILNVIN